MPQMTLLTAVALAILIASSGRSIAETTDTVPTQADVVERLDAIDNRLDAIEHLLANKPLLASSAELPGPLAQLIVELVEQVTEQAHLGNQIALETAAARGYRPPPFESRRTAAKMRDNELRTMRTIALIQSAVKKANCEATPR